MQKPGNILVKTILVLLVLSLGLAACKKPIETSTEGTLYIDQYSYEELLTPIGFNCGGAYPLIAP
jgi:hypothetical protein